MLLPVDHCRTSTIADPRRILCDLVPVEIQASGSCPIRTHRSGSFTPGAIVSVGLWLMISRLFGLYLDLDRRLARLSRNP